MGNRAENHADWYRRNRGRSGAYIRGWKQARRAENRARVFEYLTMHPCVDCSEADPVVLEFDHVNGDKMASVSEAAYARAWTWERVEAEIAKCEVRCANCHKRKTAREQGWYVGGQSQPPDMRKQIGTMV